MKEVAHLARGIIEKSTPYNYMYKLMSTSATEQRQRQPYCMLVGQFTHKRRIVIYYCNKKLLHLNCF